MSAAAASFDCLVETDPASRRADQRRGPAGSLPLTEELLRHAPSGDLFGWTQNVGMGWNPPQLGRKEFLILSTHGGLRARRRQPDRARLSHRPLGSRPAQVKAAAEELQALGCVPFAGSCTDPCDGRTQGTTGMMDSLPYRNDAAMVLRRLIRSLPTRRGVLGVATCDKGLPAMMMALAAMHDLPTRAGARRRDAAAERRRGRRQGADDRRPLRARRDHACRKRPKLGCRACASPGGGCQFLGTAATSQVVGEALGLSLPHSALAPSGQPIWLDMARRSARAVAQLSARGIDDPPHPDRRRLPQRDDRPRGVRRLDEPAAAHPRHRLCTPACAGRRSRTGTPSIARCRAWSMRCRTARSAIRRCASSWPAACRR